MSGLLYAVFFQADRLRRFVRTVLRVVTNGYGWLWMVIGGNGVVPVNFGWLRVVMGGCGWFWGGNGW